MSNFVPLVPHSIEFEGDTVSMKLRGLQRDAMNKLMQYMEVSAPDTRKIDDDTGEPEVAVKFNNPGEFQDVMLQLLPEHVKEFTGLTGADGAPISLEQMINEMYFNQLTMQIVQKLMDVSKLTKEDQKKSPE